MKKYTIEIEDKEGNTLGFIELENGKPVKGIGLELIDSDQDNLIVRHDPPNHTFKLSENDFRLFL